MNFAVTTAEQRGVEKQYMAEQKKPSVQEILALARANKAATAAAAAGAAPEAAAEAAAKPPEARDPAAAAETVPSAEAKAAREEPAAEAPAAPAPKPAAKPAGAKLSVAEMLAAARAAGAAKAGGAAPAAAAPAEAKPAPAPKPAAAEKKPVEKKEAGPVVGGPKDTSSILAAARARAKPGPMTKAEAAAKENPILAPEKPAKIAPVMPPKPDFAQPKAAKAGSKNAAAEDRRGFLTVMFGSMLGLGYTCLAVAGGLWTLGLARFMFPNILTEPPSKFPVGFPSDFAPGKVDEKFKAQFGVWIVNTEYNGKPEISAIRTVCTHLGCTPNWLEAEQKFKCPCHGSGFYKDGINFEGPAPRPLERYAISLGDDGQLQVDKSKLFFEEMGQWSDPQSFYPG